MPLPLVIAGAISAVTAARSGYVVGGLILYFKEELQSAVDIALSGDGMAGWVTEKVNQKIALTGLDLIFQNVFDVEKTKDDVDKFAARRINAKAGTEFLTIKNLTRDEFLTEVSRKIAAQVNEQTGANLAVLWPVDRLRQELGTELDRQFDSNVDLSGGALFDRASVEKIQLKIAAKFANLNGTPINGPVWGPPVNEKQALRRAKGRARQAKYRRTHVLRWQEK
jgi:hypothetical protein